jgi:hypothetical protein
MLRTDMNTIMAYMKDHVWPAEAVIDHRGHLRGYLLMDAVNLHSAIYAYADLQRLGTFCGVDAHRLDALDDGHMDYYDDESTPVLIHTT